MKNQNSNLTNMYHKKNLFDEPSLVEILESDRNNITLCELIHSKIIYNNILILKDIISKHYNQFLPNLFEIFHQLISKPSLVVEPLKKIFQIFDSNYSENKYIIIISDGNSKKNLEELRNLINEARVII